MTDKIVDQAATTAGRDLLEALVLELKMLRKPWPELVKHDQDEIIHRLCSRVTAAIQAAVHTIASEDRVVADATLTRVTFKGGIKAEFELSRTCAARHDLADAEGKLCLIVLADAQRHLEGVDSVRGEDDQRAMDLGHEYKPDSDGEGMPDHQAEDPPAPPAPPAVLRPSKGVPIKYRDRETGETWTGRGLMPKWLRARIEAGAKIEDFLVD